MALKPKNIELAVAGGVPLAALTAWQCLHDVGKIKRGQRILVHGGGGSVGKYVIQFAKAVGAHVTTTVSDWAITLVTELLFSLISRKQRSLAKKHGGRYRFVFMKANGEQLTKISQMFDAGSLRIDNDRIFDIQDFDAAFNYQASGKAKGKVVFAMKF